MLAGGGASGRPGRLTPLHSRARPLVTREAQGRYCRRYTHGFTHCRRETCSASSCPEIHCVCRQGPGPRHVYISLLSVQTYVNRKSKAHVRSSTHLFEVSKDSYSTSQTLPGRGMVRGADLRLWVWSAASHSHFTTVSQPRTYRH